MGSSEDVRPQNQGAARPKNQGSAGPNGEKPLRLDMGFEEAIQRFMKAPPTPKDAKRPERKHRGKGEQG